MPDLPMRLRGAERLCYFMALPQFPHRKARSIMLPHWVGNPSVRLIVVILFPLESRFTA